LHVGYQATHSPYDNQEPDLYASYANATFRDIPPYVPHPWHYNEGLPKWATHSLDAVRHAQRSYYAAVTDIDRNLGRVLQGLAQTGRMQNTVVVYVSDHGCAMGHHGFWGKGNSTRPLNMYETSLRVPLIMRWPGRIPAGLTVSRCTDHYDLFRALCETGGVDLSQPQLAARRHPGRSLLPLALAQDVADWQDTKFGEYGDLRMIRTARHKLVRRYPRGPDELFDLTSVPLEHVNLLGHVEAVPLRAALEAQLDTFYRAHEDPARTGLRVKELPRHNENSEAWRDGVREARGLHLTC
jgi:choline-sulfatase